MTFPTTTRSERLLARLAARAPYGQHPIRHEDGSPYLTRMYLTPERNRWLRKRAYLHCIHSSDADRELHNHPWQSSVSLILTGGYREYRWDPKNNQVRERVLLPGDVNRIGRHDFHRLELLEPERGCWTLFVAGEQAPEPEGKRWGFLIPSLDVSGNWIPGCEWFVYESEWACFKAGAHVGFPLRAIFTKDDFK